MKKQISLIIILVFLLLAGIGSAAEFPTSAVLIPVSAVTTTDYMSSAKHVDFLTNKITCAISNTGTAVTSATFKLYGSLDGVTFYPIGATHTYTTADITTYSMAFVGLEQFNSFKVKYIDKTGGGIDSAFTVTCQAGGN